MTGKNKSTGNDKIIQLPSGAAGVVLKGVPLSSRLQHVMFLHGFWRNGQKINYGHSC